MNADGKRCRTKEKKKMPDAWNQVFRLTSSAYWGIISTGSIFFHSLSLLLSRAYTEVSSFLLPSPHTVLMRGYIEIHSVKWDKVSIQSRRDYEKDFVRVCTCACVCVYFMLWYLETMSCSAQRVCNMTKQKNNIGKKRSGGGKKNSPAGFPRTQTPSFLHSLRVCQPRLPCHNQKPSMTDPQGIAHSALHTQTHTHTQPRVAWFFSIFTVMYGSERVMVILFSLPNHLNISPHSFLAVPLDMLHLYIGRFWQMHLELGTRANSNHNLPNTREICSNPTFLLA